MPVTGEEELRRTLAACDLENQNPYQRTHNPVLNEGETNQLMTSETTDIGFSKEMRQEKALWNVI